MPTGIEPPGTIENAPLLKDENDESADAELKDGLREGVDYTLVSEEAWDLLHGWYGGSPTIRRSTVTEGGAGGRPTEIQLELTMPKLVVTLDSDDASATRRADVAPLTLSISRGASVKPLAPSSSSSRARLSRTSLPRSSPSALRCPLPCSSASLRSSDSSRSRVSAR